MDIFIQGATGKLIIKDASLSLEETMTGVINELTKEVLKIDRLANAKATADKPL